MAIISSAQQCLYLTGLCLRFSALRFSPANQRYRLPFHCNTFMASPCMHCPGCAMPNVTMLCLRFAGLYLTLLYLYVTIPCFSITWCCLSSPSQRYVFPYHRVTLLCPCSMLRCYAAAVLNQALLCRHISWLYTAFALLGATAPCATLLCLCVAPHCAAVTILFEASPSQRRTIPGLT